MLQWHVFFVFCFFAHFITILWHSVVGQIKGHHGPTLALWPFFDTYAFYKSKQVLNVFVFNM